MRSYVWMAKLEVRVRVVLLHNTFATKATSPFRNAVSTIMGDKIEKPDGSYHPEPQSQGQSSSVIFE